MENRGHFHPRLPFSSDDQARAGTFAGVSTLTTTATMMFSANANRVVKVMEGYPKEPDMGNEEQPAGPPLQTLYPRDDCLSVLGARRIRVLSNR
ncbi:MAG: hypothetical protein AAAB20_18990 [Rhizobium sp.]|uniref:hypothetical protein n=1 Tax=Rhizobium sp. TaxID=391 RepID=UPI00056B9557